MTATVGPGPVQEQSVLEREVLVPAVAGRPDADAETVLYNTGDGLKTLDAVAGVGPTATIAPSYGAFAKTGLA